MALIVLVQNSLIVVGVPSTWQSVVIGLLILIGTGPARLAGEARRGAGGVMDSANARASLGRRAVRALATSRRDGSR